MQQGASASDDRGASGDESLGLSAFRQPAETHGLSLESLSAAFAQMLGRGHDPYSSVVENELPQVVVDETARRGSALTAAAEPDDCPVTPRSIVEAMLFVGLPDDLPLTSQRVASLMRGVREAEIDDCVAELNAEYAANGCPYRIESVGQGYRLALVEEFQPLRDKVLGRVRQARLSPAAIEVLAIVAYNEPITDERVAQLRGRHSKSLLDQLVRRSLLSSERAGASRHARSYRTTQRFLDLFGLTTLADLPRADDVEQR